MQTNATFVSTISFEGSTEDDFETSLTVVDPTADRTQTIQNKSGTLALIVVISYVSVIFITFSIELIISFIVISIL